MNEIIAKLYDQAIVIENGGDYVCGELDPVKFAELIVKDQQRKWVGLTDEEWESMYDKFAKYQEYGAFVSGWEKYARAIEAKLKEKNNAA